MKKFKKMKQHIKDEVISRIDKHESRRRLVAIDKSGKKIYADGLGFTRSGKHALGKLTRHQHQIMREVKNEYATK